MGADVSRGFSSDWTSLALWVFFVTIAVPPGDTALTEPSTELSRDTDESSAGSLRPTPHHPEILLLLAASTPPTQMDETVAWRLEEHLYNT